MSAILMPRIGTRWLVQGVVIYQSREEEIDLEYLVLEGQPSNQFFDARIFKKVEPPLPLAIDRRESELVG